MLNTQALADRSAIGLSVICALHCLLLPVTIVMYPNFMSFLPNDEVVHLSILFVVIPVSIFALLKGAKRHSKSSVFLVGFFGLITLVLALLLGHSIFGEHGERIFTIVGSFLVSIAHFKNFSICREQDCFCHTEKKE